MNKYLLTKFVVGFIIIFVTNIGTAFEMYIHTGYIDPPDFSSYGFKHSSIVYEQQIYSAGEDRGSISPTHIEKIISELRKKKSNIAILDIENWMNNWRKIGYNQKRIIMNRYVHTARQLKLALPEHIFGYYGIVPAWPHWDINKYEKHLNNWNEDNKLRQLVGDSVDVFYPSLYTYNENPEDWKLRATLTVFKARQMANGKKVIVFLWPRYHQSSKPYKRGIKTLPVEYWRFQLEHIKNIADGFVIWDGALGNRGTWDSSQPWWVETKVFLQEHFPEKQLRLKQQRSLSENSTLKK